jgi:hypothetical protein
VLQINPIEEQNFRQTFLNPSWRLNHLYTIVTKEGNREIFTENAIQQRINRVKHKRRMILKARQFGVSTNGILKMLDFACYNRNVTACVIAHEQDAIKKLFRIAKRAHQFLPDDMRPKLDHGGGSKYEMYFPKLNSRIYCDLESRGDTIQYLHVSEAAFIKDPDKLLATLQAVPLDGIVELESTPNGMGNYFHDLWNDEQAPYAKIFFPWYLFPEYRIESDVQEYTFEENELIEKVKRKYDITLSPHQIAFRRFKKNELKGLFLQEYPEDDQNCFLTSGNPPFDLVKIKALLEESPKPIEETETVKVYKPYEEGCHYVCGADCAEGVGGDFSVATIFKARTREQVATLRCQLKPYDFAWALKDFCHRYAPKTRPFPLLAVERNNHGHAVLLALEEVVQYPKLYRREQDDRNGWLTDKVTRPVMLDTFIDGVENGTVILKDYTTLKECLTLINNNGKIEAAQGKHDDCVIASSIAVQMCIEAASLELYDNIKSAIYV